MLRLLGFIIFFSIPAICYAERDDTLVVINQNSADSIEIGAYYAERRDIPITHIAEVYTPTGFYTDWYSFEILRDQIIAKLQQIIQLENPDFTPTVCIDSPTTYADSRYYCEESIAQLRSLSNIRYLVTTKGVPTRLLVNTRPSGYVCLGNNENQPTSIDNFIIAALDGYSENYCPGLSAAIEDDEFFIGRIDGLTVAAAKKLVDRAISAEQNGVFGKVISSKSSVDPSYSDFSNANYLFGLFNENQPECVGADTETFYFNKSYDQAEGTHIAPDNCIFQLNIRQDGFYPPGNLRSHVPEPLDTLVYYGRLDNQWTLGYTKRFSELLNWRKSKDNSGMDACLFYPDDTDPLCENLPVSYQATCIEASEDVYKEIDTRCAGVSEGFIGYNYVSFPVSLMSGMPTNWAYDTSGYNNGILFPVLSNGVGQGHNDEYSLLFINDHDIDTRCYTSSDDISMGVPSIGACSNNNEKVLIDRDDVGLTSGNIIEGINARFSFWIKGSTGNSNGASIHVSKGTSYGAYTPRAEFDSFEFMVPTNNDWQLISHNLILTTNDETDRTFGFEMVLDDPNNVFSEIRFDDFSLKIINSDMSLGTELFNNPTFDQGMKNTAWGAWAFDFLNRFNGTAFWGSTSHYRTGGTSFSTTIDNVLFGFLQGKSLGQSLWEKEYKVSGLFYGDPLYSPVSVKLNALEITNPWNFVSGTLSFNGDALNGTDIVVNTFYHISFCPLRDIMVCDQNNLWQGTNLSGTGKERNISFGTLDISSFSPMEYLFRLSVLTNNSSLGDQQIFNDYKKIVIYDATSDFDKDMLNDVDELAQGSDPTVFDDLDGDGLPDAWELANGTQISVNDAYDDLDGDGAENYLEFYYGTAANDNQDIPTLKTVYVDAENGSDTEGDGTQASPFQTLDRATSYAQEGDTIQLESGSYYTNISFDKKILNFNGATDRSTELYGFYILFNGKKSFTGITFSPIYGVFIHDSLITLQNCTFKSDNLISDVILNANGELQLNNILFAAGNTNSAKSPLTVYSSGDVTATNITVAGFDTGITIESEAAISIRNSILNNNDDILILPGGAVDISYSLISDPEYAGQNNNSDADPLFINADYHVRSDSPAVDSGDPASDYSNEPDYPLGHVNMGFYGNTDEAETPIGLVQLLPMADWVIKNTVSGAWSYIWNDEIILIFGGLDINYYHSTYPNIQVDPSHRYRISGKMLLTDITSTNGVSLEVQDQRGYGIVRWAKRTEELVGSTTDWVSVSLEFVPLDGTNEIKVILRRHSGGGNISGSVRLKDVAIEDMGRAFSVVDWNIKPIAGVTVSQDVDSVNIEFIDAGDVNYHHTRIRSIDINPSHNYRLTGKLKTEDLTSMNGVSLEVQDERGWADTHWARSTEKLLGTTNWVTTSIEFTPPEDAEQLQIILRRQSSGGSITGNASVKDVILYDLGPIQQ